MLKYIFKRLFTWIFLLVAVIFMAFMLLHLFGNLMGHRFLVGGTPEALWEWREMRGLNDPVLIQYTRYMAGIFRGDLGNSFWSSMSVTEEVMTRLTYTLGLSLAALSAALILALPIGIIAALKRNTWIDKLSMFIVYIGISIPAMWLGVLLIHLRALHIGWSPVVRRGNSWDIFVLPAITLGTVMLAAMIGIIRSSVLEAMEQNYIRIAQAKGLSGGRVIFKHVLPNIIIPVLTSFKANLGVFFTGIIIVENLFARPGISRLLLQGVANRDYPVILGSLFMLILFFALLNFVVDIIKAFADPRMRRESLC